jgi:glycosyltransferase involved in cell wall biosynthesis
MFQCLVAADSKLLAMAKQLQVSRLAPNKRIELKIVFLVKRFYTNKDLIEDRFGRLFYFPSILGDMGHECVVFALDFKSKEEVNICRNNVRFRNIPVKSFWRFPSMRKLFRDLKTSEADVVFSSGDSYLGYWGMRLSKRLSAMSVFDIYDDYSHFASNKIPFMRTLLESAVSKSDLVVCASEPIGKKYRAYQENILIVQNGVDKNVFRPEEKQIAREKCGVDSDDIVVGYFGSIHKPRGVDDLVMAIKRLRARGQDIKLLMAGRDYREVDFDYPWIDCRGMVEQDEVVAMINSCDVVTMPYKDTELIRMTNACKLMEYIACRVPVVVTDVSDYASYFPDSFGCVAKPSNPDSLADAIAKQLKDKNVVDDEQVLAWEKLAARLEKSIRKLGCEV